MTVAEGVSELAARSMQVLGLGFIIVMLFQGTIGVFGIDIIVGWI